MRLGLGLNISLPTKNPSPRTVILEVLAGLLDDYTTGLVGWWGLKKRFTTYLGNGIRVRRDSDNAEENIGFDNSTGLIDTDAIAAFCGAANGYIARIYDQSGSQNNIQCNTLSKQYMIYDGSAVVTKSGLPYIGTNSGKTLTTGGSSSGKYEVVLGTAASLGFGTTSAAFEASVIYVGGSNEKDHDGLVVLKDGSGNKQRFSSYPSAKWNVWYGPTSSTASHNYQDESNIIRTYACSISDLTVSDMNYSVVSAGLSSVNPSTGGSLNAIGKPDYTSGNITLEVLSSHTSRTYQGNVFEFGLYSNAFSDSELVTLNSLLHIDLGL